MRSNNAATITILVAMVLSMGSNSASAQYVARPKRPVPAPPATAPQKPPTNTNTRSAPRLTFGERCGPEGAGQTVYVENTSKERSKANVRETWKSERGEQRTRDHNLDLAGLEKRRISCTFGNTLIEYHYFKVIS